MPSPSVVTTTVCRLGTKAAEVTRSSVISRVQVAPCPVHAPDHWANRDVPATVAVKVTMAPCSKVATQLAPQSIPGGLERTEPSPVTVTVSDGVGAHAPPRHCPVGAQSRSE